MRLILTRLYIATWTLVCAIGCVTTSNTLMDRCGPAPEQLPVAEASCLARPAVGDCLNRLSPPIEANAISLRVRVEFDAQSEPMFVCSMKPENGVHRSRLARRKLNEALPEIRGVGPGPACLAEHGLVFNLLGAKDWEIDATERRCKKRARLTREAAEDYSNVPTQIAWRDYNRCVEHERDWVYARIRGQRNYYLFSATRPRSERTQTIDRLRLRCRKFSRAEAFLACMSEQGWELPPRQTDFGEDWPNGVYIELSRHRDD